MSQSSSLELVVGRPAYRYYTAWTISGELALELDMSGVTWSRQVRLAGSFSGTAGFSNETQLADAYQGTMPGLMSLYVTRNGKPVWGGIIARRSYDAATQRLQIDAVGFESYLYRRVIWHDLEFANTVDQYSVVRGLISAMQADFTGFASPDDGVTSRPESANIGLTVDPVLSGRTQDKQFFQGGQLTSFGEAIEGFSDNLNGFEYNIDVDWNLARNRFTKQLVFRPAPPSQLPLYAIYQGERTGIEENFFEFPGNILSVGYEDTVDDSATRQFVVGVQPDQVEGAPEDAPQPPPLRGSWNNEPYLSTQWPLLEMVESSDHTDVSRVETLKGYAQSIGQRVHPPIPGWSVTVDGSLNPQPGSYRPGDWCRFVVSDPFLGESFKTEGDLEYKVFTKRIIAFSVSVPDTTQLPETVELTLVDEANDEE